MPAELGQAELNYGRAMCLPADREFLPMDQLTPEERDCVTRIAAGFEDAIQAHFGPLVDHKQAYRQVMLAWL